MVLFTNLNPSPSARRRVSFTFVYEYRASDLEEGREARYPIDSRGYNK